MFPGLCGARSQKGWHLRVLSRPGSQARPLPRGEKAINAGLQSKSAQGGSAGGRVFKTNINLSGKRQYWAKTKCQGLLATSPGVPPPHPTPSIHLYLKILTAHNTH